MARMRVLRLPALILGPFVAAGAQNPILKLTHQALAPRIDVLSGFTNGNVLALRADSATLLIDAQSERRVGLVDSALASLGASPVRLVINTHYHDDHIQGNAHFRRQGARILAHRNVAVQAAKDTVIASWNNWRRVAAAPEALPSVAFGDSTVLQFGDQEVRVYHMPNAHTDGDAVIWFPRANILHLGDIFELGAPPFIDWWAGGSLGGMIAAIDRVLPLIDERTRIIPGHGPVADRAGLLEYRAMLVTLQLRVQRALDAGTSVEQLLAERPTAEYAERLGGTSQGDRLTRLIFVGLAARRRGE